MLLSINWLKDFVSVDASVEEISQRLIMAGFEVEETIETGIKWDNIIVGEIIKVAPHPEADKLLLAKVKADYKTYSVVCGASNIAVGNKVPLALDGAVLPSGIKIKTTKIRGKISEGMLCSESELCLGGDATGIMILPENLRPGMPLSNALELNDTILDVTITPNRPDCLCIMGLAREVSAIFGIPFSMHEIKLSEQGERVENIIAVEIIDPELCPRYTARIIDNVTIRPSPLLIRQRLENAGIRSINNVVDATNYVLLEYGQPLHAFDFDLLAGHKIIVKRARHGDKFLTLDGNEKILPPDALMICDSKNPVAIAGIMGGQNSEVHEKTSRILLESAYFSPASIRKTSRAIGLKTEASQRFERGVDIEGVIPALNRAAMLIAKWSRGKVAPGVIDNYPKPVNIPTPINLSITKTNKITGIKSNKNEIIHILKKLFMHVEDKSADNLQVTPPSFRQDIHEAVDIIEEIARLGGYQRIPATVPKAIITANPPEKSQTVISKVRDIMVSMGFYEVINYSFISQACLQNLNFNDTDPRLNPVRIANPLSESQTVLRTTLIPSLLINLRDNLRHKNSSIKLFEVSTVFFQNPDSSIPFERKRVAGILSGLLYGESWNTPHSAVDFFDIKGTIETLVDRLYITAFRFAHDKPEPFLDPDVSLSLMLNNHPVGSAGKLSDEVLEKYDIPDTAYIFELDFDAIMPYALQKVTFKPFARNPAVYRDLALIVDENVPAESIYQAILSFNHELIREVKIFDCYRGNQIPEGKKSLAYRVKFQAQNRNLTDSEINKIHEKLIAYLAKRVGAQLRH